MRATLAVILARGLGTRLQREDGAELDAGQQMAAARGIKGLMPVAGRPLLDYALSAMADAGVHDVVFVVSPGDSPLRQRYDVDAPPQRIRVRFAVQDEPRGTAHALLAAREAVCAPLGASADAQGKRHFLMCNADNLYSADALRALVEAQGPSLIAYDADTLVRESGIEPERVQRFALLDIAEDGSLRDIVEKPAADHPLLSAAHAQRWVSMNLWRFTDEIFDACVTVTPSPRGELELVDAVRLSMASGMRYMTLRRAEPVLDLTHRRDVAMLGAKLSTWVPRP